MRREMEIDKLTVAVDIDGILTNETEGWNYHLRTPNQKNIDAVNALYDAGHLVILYSARHVEDMEATKEWMEKHGVRHHAITLGKMHYDVMIDDKTFSSFE